MSPVMPGCAFITGIFSCFNYRVLDPVRKPKTVTFDAEIPIGENDNRELQCIKGIVHYFVPSHERSPPDDHKFFVSGKVVSISQQDGEDLVEYDVQVDAMTLFLMPDVDDPPRCQIMIAGQSTEKVTDHQFYMDITQYFMRQPAANASFHCYFPEGNIRFERVGVPRPKTQTVVIGFIMANSTPFTNTCAVKRIPMEIGDIQYLPPPSTSVSSPQKAGSSSRFRKNVDISVVPEASSSTVAEVIPSTVVSQSVPSQGSETMSERDVNDHVEEQHSGVKKRRRA